MGLLALDTFPLQSTLAQAVGRPEPEGRQADGSSCRLWERQGQGEQGGADEEQLLSFPRADGRPEDWHTIYFIHGKIQVYFAHGPIIHIEHQSGQGEGKL